MAQFLPLVSVGALERDQNQTTGEATNIVETKTSSLPPFPEDLKRPPTDWASIDWDRETVLPKDEGEYYKEAQRLAELGREIKLQTWRQKCRIFMMRKSCARIGFLLKFSAR